MVAIRKIMHHSIKIYRLWERSSCSRQMKCKFSVTTLVNKIHHHHRITLLKHNAQAALKLRTGDSGRSKSRLAAGFAPCADIIEPEVDGLDPVP